jgi:hypothetical protein
VGTSSCGKWAWERRSLCNDRVKQVNVNEVLTAVLTLITGIYAFLTWRILRTNQEVVSAMRAEREARMRP